jgi:hypothetical protein
MTDPATSGGGKSEASPFWRSAWLTCVVAWAVAGCAFEPNGATRVDANVPFGAPPGAATQQGMPLVPPPPGSLEAVIVSPGEAQAAGYAWQSTLVSFGEGQDGTKLLMDLLARAKAKGAPFVSDVVLHFASAKNGKPLECVVGIQPEDVPRPVVVPEKVKVVPVTVPVTRQVSEPNYVCRPVSRSVTRMVTDYQQRCSMVSHPVTHMETTYSYQYDYTSHSSRSVPQSRSVTTYEYQNECHSEPVSRTVFETKMEQECHTEYVTRSVTRPEFQLQTQFVPPHLEYVQARKLRETEPVCYETDLAPDRGNRLEAKIYLPKAR